MTKQRCPSGSRRDKKTGKCQRKDRFYCPDCGEEAVAMVTRRGIFYHTVQDIQKAVIGLEVSQTDGVGI
jgi:transposase-like protein